MSTTANDSSDGLYDAFISYSRTDSFFVRNLVDALQSNQRTVWIDFEGIPPTVEWLSEILNAIDRSRCFLFVISPDSLRSRFVNLEVKHALAQGKHIVPIYFRNPGDVPISEEIKKRQYVDATCLPNSNELADVVLRAMDIDPQWLNFHTNLLIRTAQWATEPKTTDLLLRGSELRSADNQIKSSLARIPKITKIQLDFIEYSHRYIRKRRYRRIAIVSLITCVVTGLSFFGITRWRTSVAQSLSSAASNATVTPSRSNGFVDKGLLLAATALTLENSPTSREVLLNTLQHYPKLSAYLVLERKQIIPFIINELCYNND